MITSSRPPRTAKEKAVEHIMTLLELSEDLNSEQKFIIAQYVEELEEDLRGCALVANKHGWHDGDERPARRVKGSRALIPLSTFFSQQLEQLERTEVQLQMLMADDGGEFE